MAEEDVLDAGPENPPNQRPLINQNPQAIVNVLYSGFSFLQVYGWFLLLGFILLMVLWSNISDSVKKFFRSKKPAYNRDITDSMTPEQIEARMVGMERARQRMQERYTAQAQEKAARLKELEEQKRQQKIDDHDAMKAGKSQSSTLHKLEQKHVPADTKQAFKRKEGAKPLRGNDSNPLSGGSSNTPRWRSSRPQSSGGG